MKNLDYSIFLIVSLISLAEFIKYVNAGNYKVCNSDHCQRLADNLKRDMNTKADPCSNFFDYSCGGFVKNNPIPPTKTKHSQFVALHELRVNRTIEFLKSPIKASEIKPFQHAKQIFQMCSDNASLNKIGLKPVTKILNSFGGWPMIHPNWSSNKPKLWQDVFKFIMTFLTTGLFEISPAADLLDSTIERVTLSQSSLTLPREFMIEPALPVATAYQTNVKRVVSGFLKDGKITVSSDAIDKDVMAMLLLEGQLAKIMLTEVEKRDTVKLYNPITIKDWQAKWDSFGIKGESVKIDWLAMIQAMFNGVHFKITSDEVIVVQSFEFFQKLSSVIEKTPSRTLVNYLLWQFVRDIIPHTTDEMRDVLFQYNREMFNVQELPPRDIVCEESPNLKTAISYAYVKQYFSETLVKRVEEIIDDVRQAVSVRISKATWMDDKTKKKTFEKLNAIKKFIAYPSWFNDTAITKLYEQNEFEMSNDYVQVMINVKQFDGRIMLARLRGKNKFVWMMEPTVVNAFYFPSENSITFLAAILQDLMFTDERPPSMNYGAIGMIAGHEISHAFDDVGRLYDKDGNVSPWWSDETIAAYQNKTKCFVEQYNKYIVLEKSSKGTPIYIDGLLTLGENIGDAAGMIAAYNAYKTRIKSGVQEVRLPGFENFSGDQLFFISFANSFCEITRPEFLEINAATNPHPVHNVRIRGSLSNLNAFGKAFNCPPGSPMNPKQKCSLWS